MKTTLLPVALLAAGLLANVHAREFDVVSYNVENLFDADRVAAFTDYDETSAPDSYTPVHVLNKLRGVASVLKTFNNGKGPDVVAFNEIEMDFTPDSGVPDMDAFLEKYKDTTVEKMLTTELTDEIRGLPSEALLLKHLADQGMTGYHVAIGADKPDLETLAAKGRRAHVKAQKNVVFSKFPITSVKSHPTESARDILETELSVDGHPFTIFVNHWKSGASSGESEKSRRANAQTLRDRLNEIFSENPSADILLVGDFNSQYNQSQVYPYMTPTGVNDILGSQGDETATAHATNYSLYNLWYELPPDQRKSDQFKGEWGTLIQQMITPGLYDNNGIQYVDNSFKVVALDGINLHTPLKLPRRWSNAGKGSGTSDHLPTVSRFRTVEDGDKETRIALENPGKDDGSSKALSVGYETLKAGRLPVFDEKIAKDPVAHEGDIFHVKGRITVQNPLTVKAGGEEFLLWSYDFDFRRELQKFPVGKDVEFIGQLGMHKGKWQLVVQIPSWMIAPKMGS